jgi:hypothetical protein
MSTESIQQEPQDAAAHRQAAADLPVLAPAEAAERLRRGERLERVRICRMKLEGDFPKPLELVHCVLERPEIRKAVFHGPVAFSRSEIVGLTFGRGPVVFEQGLAFKSCTVRRLRMDFVTLKGQMSFDNSDVYGTLKLSQCELGGTHAWETKFHGWVDLGKCMVHGALDFRSAHLEEGLVLQSCRLDGDAIFRGMVCAKKLDFTDSQCAATIDLSKAKLHDYVYLEGIQAGERCRFALLNAVADRLLIQPEQLKQRLLSELEGRYDDARHEYGLLKASYQTLHRFDDEDWALYRFKVSQRRGKPRSWTRPWTRLQQAFDLVFLDWGCGYGTKPARAVATACVLMLFFALIYAAGINHFEIEHLPIADLPKTHWANRLLFGMLATVSVFTSGFSGDQLHQAHGWILVPLAAEALLGTLLWGLFVVAFSRKVIR